MRIRVYPQLKRIALVLDYGGKTLQCPMVFGFIFAGNRAKP